MTTNALGAAISGLRVAQRGLDVTATNLASATTPGYTRKILSQEAVIAGDTGVGVRYGEIQRFVDQSLQRDYRVQLGVDTYLNTTQTYLQRIIAVHGSTDSESNLGAQIGKLYNQFVQLSNAPDSRTQQAAVIAQAQKLVTTFHNVASQMDVMRNDVQKTLTQEVVDLNTTLKQIAEYNKRVQSLESTGRSSATIQDQRDELVKKVASQLDVTYYTDGDGTLVLQTKNGQVLADTEARTITTDGQLLTSSMLYPDTLGGLVIQDSNTGGYDLAAINPGGRIGALLNLRDNTLPAYTAQLDELAHTMMVRFDDQDLRLFTDENGVIPANDPAVYVGLAARMKVNPLILNDPTLLQHGTAGGSVAAGSNALITSVLNYTFGRFKDAGGTANQGFASTDLGANRSINLRTLADPNSTLEQYAAGMIDSQAQDYNTAKTDYDSEHQYMQEVETRLLDTSAVNTDEEMAHMIELQKSYAASAKMVSALDELFRDLLNAV